MRVLVLSLLFSSWGCTLTTKFEDVGECTAPDLFGMEPGEYDPGCPRGFFCMGEYDVDADRFTTSCRDMEQATDLEYFANCDSGQLCPVGSSCVDSGGSGGAYCQPWCSRSHRECPDNSECSIPEGIVHVDDHAILPCVRKHSCYDLFEKESCDLGYVCAPMVDTGVTYCQRFGGSPAGGECVLNTADPNSACDRYMVCVPKGGGVWGRCHVTCETEGSSSQCNGLQCLLIHYTYPDLGLCLLDGLPESQKRR